MSMNVSGSGAGKRIRRCLVLVACFTALAACNKDDEALPGREQQLLGRWRVVSVGRDLDRNGTLDSSELVLASDSIASDVEYAPGGQGARTTTFWQTPVSRPFEWTLDAGGTQLFEVRTSNSGVKITDTAHIRELNDQQLVVVELQQGDSMHITYQRL